MLGGKVLRRFFNFKTRIRKVKSNSSIKHLKSECRSLSDFIDASIINKFLNLRNTDNNGYILDLGCGTGRHAINMIYGSLKIIGLDVNLASVSCAKKRFSDKGINEHFFLSADATQIPLRDKVVNYVVCNAVLQHISDYRKVIYEVSRVVKPGGVAIFGVLNRTLFEDMGIFNLALKWPSWIKKIIFSKYLLYSNIDLHEIKDTCTLTQGSFEALGIKQTFSLSHLKEIFSANNLEIVEYEYLEKLFGKLAQRIKYMLKFGRSKKFARVLYLLSSIDLLLPQEMEGNTLFVKAVKK